MDFDGEGVFRNTLDLPEISQVHQNSIKLNCRHLQEKKKSSIASSIVHGNY
jgi:hypothetical protein